MRKTRKILAVLLAATMTFALGGCVTTQDPTASVDSGSSSESSSSASSSASSSSSSSSGSSSESSSSSASGAVPDEGTVVYIARALSDPFAALNAQAAQEAFLEAYPNWTFTIKDADNDAAKLIQILEDAATQGVDIVYDGGVAGADATQAVKDAQAAGVFVFGVEVAASEVEPEIAPYICVDFYHTYKVLMDWSLDQIPENANAVVLSSIEGFDPCIERERALNEMLEERPDINVLAWQYCDYDTTEAMNQMEDWLQHYDNIDAVISLTDTMAIGAIEAYRANNIDCTDVWICGVDALLDACSYIESGELTVSVFRPPSAYAEAEVELIEDYYAGNVEDGEVRVI